jgi:alkanesulfonate monooxygenase SsuD/methylene tetrahydromethanopterin reductase-like flavin-dependent oxidoreductase (luciferase family)
VSIGVLSQIHNPTLSQVRELAEAAEAAGADWLGVPDAFWWRDTWLLAAEAARATARLGVGPLVTNPYLRHPFHTIAAIATLQEIAGPRVILGLGAGGSEVPLSTGIQRRDAPAQVADLAELIRQVANGAPLSQESRRSLEPPLICPEITIAGRAAAILRTGGAVADNVLLWAVPRNELSRSRELIDEGAAGREIPPTVTWAPLLVNANARDSMGTQHSAAYAALNSRRATKREWGLDDASEVEIRRAVVAGEPIRGLLPDAALQDVLVPLGEIDAAVELARSFGPQRIAVPAADVDEVRERVQWARAVLEGLIATAV